MIAQCNYNVAIASIAVGHQEEEERIILYLVNIILDTRQT